MPGAERDRGVARDPLLLDVRTRRRWAQAGQRADGRALDAGRRIDDRLARLGGGQHDVMEDRRGAGDAAGKVQPAAVEVADPRADRDGARVADRPVVAVRLWGD